MLKKRFSIGANKPSETQLQIEVRGYQVPVRVIQEVRRSVRASVGKKSASLRIPKFLRPEAQAQHLHWFKTWLEQQADKQPGIFQKFATKDYRSGDTLVVGKRQYRLQIQYVDKTSCTGKLSDGVLALQLSATSTSHKTIAQLISRLIAKDFLPEIRQRVQELNARFFQKPIKKISLKYNYSNWGSCSSKGNINLSTRLLLAPERVLDYVIIHELAHLVELNHSARFWQLVKAAMPDYQEQEKWLKAHGNSCMF